jgi:hypothetical protein
MLIGFSERHVGERESTPNRITTFGSRFIGKHARATLFSSRPVHIDSNSAVTAATVVFTGKFTIKKKKKKTVRCITEESNA